MRVATPNPWMRSGDWAARRQVLRGPSWKPQLEHERELQAVAAARRVEELVAEQPRHVVLAGDLDATPDSAGIRSRGATR